MLPTEIYLKLFSSSLWSTINLSPILMEQDADWQTCFHGKNLEDCHRNTISKNCQYWHFTPSERKNELLDKYNEIIGHKKQDSAVVHQFKDVKFELEKILGFRT